MRTTRIPALTAALAACVAITSCGSDSGVASTSTPAPVTSRATGAAAPTSATSPSAASSAPAPSGAATCAAQQHYLDSLTLRQKLGQLLVVGVTGAADARSAVARGVGGVFIGSWTDQSVFSGGVLQSISSAAKVPPMVTIDEEGGRVSRLPGADLPSARRLAATMSPAQTRAEGKRVGALLAKAGITVDFAPDADVSDEAADDVIGDRSFSNDPQKVAQYAAAFAAGLRDAGIYPVYKHFPGHGHGSGDSHKGSVTTPPLSAMKTDDLVPFRAVAGEDAGVMVGHLEVPGLTGGLPASLSPAAMSLLREGAGYGAKAHTGPIFTDDLSGMAAISGSYSIAQAVTKAITAGADVALWITTDDLSGVLDTLTAAVRSGKLPRRAVDASVLRVAAVKHLARC
ncbi:glycoside hydrolase family 3 N-terminal domain-containing protein [Tsukamurella sp. 8F]|uniref:glycoside hydrolase family 3 N-terminal domain-containing protein n=1 Tax=unclassified Tsukamurella TaxID=2633480 RepID=UPI0023B8990D|nr:MULTISPECIES: glycoside hydrolase family 3 N-terminal domain-containing protein [unclassified Tsukamurella]MDF0529876.1 glycoside hydrolase family 3 N-terminal domain-containing protein [Tsukamurella sp. 8J]MDF0588669.1 glycoside hydrolase family 3 N-terminal domain-containing protein [Tsukamurella sp. 8F]